MSEGNGKAPDTDTPVILGAQVAGGTPGIKIQRTSPDAVIFHDVEDHELEHMIMLSRPVAFAVSTTALGAFLGMVPSVLDVFGSIRANTPITSYDAAKLIFWAACGGVGVVAGVFAIKGLKEADRILKAIRARTPHPAQ